MGTGLKKIGALRLVEYRRNVGGCSEQVLWPFKLEVVGTIDLSDLKISKKRGPFILHTRVLPFKHLPV